MRSLIVAAAAGILQTAAVAAPEGLDIYFIDVEGGAATLIVTASGESILIDSGFPVERDAKRILHAAEVAGLKKIDHHLITHWHLDHYGSTAAVAAKLPIVNFYNRGVPEKLTDDGAFPKRVEGYLKASGGKSTALKAGDLFPLKPSEGKPALELKVVAANGLTVGTNTEHGCKDHPAKPIDNSDNAKSVATLLSYGPFKFLNCGDLTWNIEHKLVCPTNAVGTVDVYMVTHHGMNISNNPALVKAVQPRVTVMCNGPRKGGSKDVVAMLKTLPGVQANFQLHRNFSTTKEENTDAELIANKTDTDDCQGEFIKLSVSADGKSYTVTIGEKGTPRKFETK